MCEQVCVCVCVCVCICLHACAQGIAIMSFKHFSIGFVCFIQNFCRQRIIQKRINVRVEHVQHSKCRDEFLERVKRNDELKRKAKQTGEKFDLKRHVRLGLHCTATYVH